MGVDPPLIHGESTGGEQAWEEADTRHRQQLARRLEAVTKQLDQLRSELESIADEVEIGP